MIQKVIIQQKMSLATAIELCPNQLNSVHTSVLLSASSFAEVAVYVSATPLYLPFTPSYVGFIRRLDYFRDFLASQNHNTF